MEGTDTTSSDCEEGTESGVARTRTNGLVRKLIRRRLQPRFLRRRSASLELERSAQGLLNGLNSRLETLRNGRIGARTTSIVLFSSCSAAKWAASGVQGGAGDGSHRRHVFLVLLPTLLAQPRRVGLLVRKSGASTPRGGVRAAHRLMAPQLGLARTLPFTPAPLAIVSPYSTPAPFAWPSCRQTTHTWWMWS